MAELNTKSKANWTRLGLENGFLFDLETVCGERLRLFSAVWAFTPGPLLFSLSPSLLPPPAGAAKPLATSFFLFLFPHPNPPQRQEAVWRVGGAFQGWKRGHAAVLPLTPVSCPVIPDELGERAGNEEGNGWLSEYRSFCGRSGSEWATGWMRGRETMSLCMSQECWSGPRPCALYPSRGAESNVTPSWKDFVAPSTTQSVGSGCKGASELGVWHEGLLAGARWVTWENAAIYSAIITIQLYKYFIICVLFVYYVTSMFKYQQQHLDNKFVMVTM